MLAIRDVHRALGQRPVLRGISLEVEAGEILCLLGPSGCGKTTLLRVIAGLEGIDSGDVLLDGASIRDVAVHRRGFGLMFQDFALFPHLNVGANVAFGLKMQGATKAEQARRVGEVLELVNLRGFEGRDVASLSGGERQRVALARSLAPNPRLLMLDEPLGSLDAALREELMVDLRAIIKRLGLTALYVTHDQREAFAVADRMAIMNAGLLEQIDTPTRIYQRPATTFAAGFLGLGNIVPVLAQRDGEVVTPVGTFALAGTADALLLHPDGIHVAAAGDVAAIAVVVTERVFQGDVFRLRVQHESGTQLTFKQAALAQPMAAVGETVGITIAAAAVIGLRRSANG